MVCDRRREEEPGGTGIQNQKQEPHTKMWGIRSNVRHFSNLYGFQKHGKERAKGDKGDIVSN